MDQRLKQESRGSSALVLIVQHVTEEHPGLIADALGELGIRMEICRADTGDMLPSRVDGYDGFVLMGGPQAADDETAHPYLRDEKRLVRSAITLGLPVLGICLGCQILAECLGGEVKRGAGHEVGWYEVRKHESADADALFRDLPMTFVPLHWHGDVIEVPPGCVELGSSGATAIQGFSFSARCYGLLFHLEMTRQMLHTMCDSFTLDLASAGVSRADILAMSTSRLKKLEPVARKFFRRWGELVLANF